MAGKSVLAAADPPDVSVFAPISRVTPQPDGTLLIHAVVTNEKPDSDGEIIDYESVKAVAKEFMEWPSLKEMHDPDTASGTILKLYFDDDARQVEADIHVVDPTAVKKVLAKVYRMVSIHGEAIRHKATQIDGRTIKRRFMDFVDEISLVDRGANPDANIARRFVLAKRDGTRDVAEGPSDEVVSDEQGREPEAEAVEKRDVDPNVGGGVDRDKLPAADFAGPDRSFPIVKPGDVSDAASSLGRASESERASIQAKIIAIAHRKGEAFVAQLPEAWKEPEVDKTAKAAAKAAETEEPEEDEGKKPFPGARPPFKAEKSKMTKAEKKAAKMAKREAAKVRKQERLAARTPEEIAVDEKLAEARKIRKLRRVQKDYDRERAWLVKKNKALDDALDAHEKVGDAMAEETQEQAEGEDETKDLEALESADDALHEFAENESTEIEKRTKALRTAAGHVRKYRRAARSLTRERAKVAKYGKTISQSTAKQLRTIHDAVMKMDGSVCKAAPDTMETAQTTASNPAPNVGVEVGTVAKSATGVDLEALLREAVPAIMETQLTAIKDSLSAQERRVEEVAKAGSNGGPAIYGHYDRETGTWTPLTETTVSKADTTSSAYEAVIATLADNDPLKRELGIAKAKAELATERPWRR